MYGLEAHTSLKFRIIELLDKTAMPLTSLEIQKAIGLASQTTILNCCHEIQEMISQIYSEEAVSLLISPKYGIQLIRNSSSLQYLYDAFYSSDLLCEIAEKLIQKRQFSTNDFCEEHGVSVSKLKRKVKEANKLLADYQIHVSVSSQVTIKADEIQIRMFSYGFLYGVHRQFSQISWIDNKPEILTLAAKILGYLHLEVTEQKIELLAISLYVQSVGIRLGKPVSFQRTQNMILTSLAIPEKPPFLPDWTEKDWQLLMTFIQSYEPFGFTKNLKPFPEEYEHRFMRISTSWITSFEQFFLPLSPEKKLLAQELQRRELVSRNFFKMNENFFHIQDFTIGFKENYPSYFNRFATFWDQFMQQHELEIPQEHLLFQNHLLICLYLCPIESILPELKINLQSDLNFLLTHHLKEQIVISLKQTHQVQFVDSKEQAQLVISTTPQKIILTPPQQSLLVRLPFTYQDGAVLQKIAHCIV